MLFKDIICSTLVMNCQIASALNLKNLLLRSQSVISRITKKIKKPNAAFIEQNSSYPQIATNIENGKNQIQRPGILNFEQNTSKSPMLTSGNTLSDLTYLLIILNFILIFFGFLLILYKTINILKRNFNKKRDKTNFYRRKRKNIVNNPQSEAYFEDF